MYILRFCLLIFYFHISLPIYAQQGKNKFSIYITDNKNVQYQAFEYSVTQDSLVISGLSDYGKSKIDYSRRAFTAEEKTRLSKFMLQFPLAKFSELYFKDYANLGYISPEHFPRVIDITISNLGKSKKIRINNCYVVEFAGLFDLLNTMLGDEVKIVYDAKDLGK